MTVNGRVLRVSGRLGRFVIFVFVVLRLQAAEPLSGRWLLTSQEIGGQKNTETLWDDAALLVTLSEIFGLQFSPETRFRYGT